MAAALLAAFVSCAGVSCARAAPIPPGDGSQQAALPATTLEVFTHRPACTPRALLLVFHGVERNPAAYRDHAAPLADRICAIIVTPLFDRARFPRDLYQYGGVAEETAPHRTVDLVAPLIAWAREATGQPGLPVILLGHSAGSQFLVRVAAFAPPTGARFVVANPSTWVWPDATKVPFGFGTAPDSAIRAYLALPLSVLLGGNDTGTRNLAMSSEAMAQGPNRLTRGRAAFAAAQEIARRHGWPFNWTIAEVPGVGHDATAMFASPQALTATQAAIGR